MMTFRVLAMSILLLACSADSVVAQVGTEPDQTPDDTIMSIYVTPFYDSKGPQVAVGEYSKKLTDADAGSILPLAADFKKKKGKLRAEVMFVLSIRLFDLGHKDEAVYWFYTAQYQARVVRSIVNPEGGGNIGDATFELLQAQAAFVQLVGLYINRYAIREPDKLVKTLATVLKEGESLPEFEKLYPDVKFIKAEAWAEKNKEISAGLTELIAMIKTEGESLQARLKNPDVDPPLIQRIKAHDAAGAEKLIREGANVDEKGEDSETPLVVAIETGGKDVFLALLKHGADPNAHNGKGATAVHAAAEQEDVSWLTEVLAHCGDVDAVNVGNRFYPKQTPLFYAVSKRRKDTTRLLINSKANLNHVDYYGCNLVYNAMAQAMYPEVKLMIEKGADPKLWARGELSILHNNGWFQPRRGIMPGFESKKNGYYELYNFLTDKGYLPLRPDRGESPKKGDESK